MKHVRKGKKSARMLRITTPFYVVIIGILAGCFADVQTLRRAEMGPSFKELPVAGPQVVGVALSGGGSRAAYFGAAGLEALASLKDETAHSSVLENISYLSSVSGGSVASSYFSMKKPNRDVRVLNSDGSLSTQYVDFFRSYLDTMASNIQRGLEFRQFYKVRWFHSNQRASSLAEQLDASFLDGATFQQLYERERRGDSPRLIMNATFYNTARRAAMTTLPSDAFKYYFIEKLQQELKDTSPSNVPIKPLPLSLKQANEALVPQTFADIRANPRDIALSRAVAASASFPPLIGPITVQVEGDESKTYHHVGDGGLFDNQGTESLVQLLLKQHEEKAIKKALIVAFDSSFPFTGKLEMLNHMDNGFKIFTDDPGRIVGIMEVRANAYQSALWHTLQQKGLLLPNDSQFKVIIIRHTDDVWPENWKSELPSECNDEAKKWITKQDIVQHLALIPTLFKINSACDRALLHKAAHLGVRRSAHEIQSFLSAR